MFDKNYYEQRINDLKEEIKSIGKEIMDNNNSSLGMFLGAYDSHVKNQDKILQRLRDKQYKLAESERIMKEHDSGGEVVKDEEFDGNPIVDIEEEVDKEVESTIDDRVDKNIDEKEEDNKKS